MKIKLYRLSLTRYLLAFFFFLSISFKAQNAFLISFPVDPPPSLTTCFGSSKLTVQLDATIASTTGGDVTIQLATGVNYVPGSVALVSTIGGLSIAENGGTANAPKFIVSPATLSPGNRIIFTIDRTATCATRTHALASGIFKDTVTASIGASSDTKASSSYQINYPVLTFTQPAAQNNAVVGTTYTRTFNIKNGGNGCLRQLYLSLDNPSSGIQQISLQVTKHGTTSITPITITPTSTSGTTTYYTVPSSALPGGDLCTNEDITITETYKVLKCNAVTNYSAGWGCDPAPANWCETKTGSGSISMAVGVPDFTITNSGLLNYTDNACAPHDFTYTVTNTGTGSAGAATLYNIRVTNQGVDNSPTARYTLSNYRIGTTTITPSYNNTGNNATQTFDFAAIALTTDPDGPGVGLEDVDGDGFYDDLPKGNVLVITTTLTIKDKRTSYCAAMDSSPYYLRGNLNVGYSTMCSPTVTFPKQYTIGSMIFVGYIDSSVLTLNNFTQSTIQGGTPFRADFDLTASTPGVGDAFNFWPTSATKRRWVHTFTLPAGMTLSGTGGVTIDGAAATATVTGNVVTVTRTGNARPGRVGINFLYTCGVDGPVTIPYTLEFIDDYTAPCLINNEAFCYNFTMSVAGCAPCAAGPSVSLPTVRRDDNSYGYTDGTLTTRVAYTAIPANEQKQALYYDVVRIEGKMTQNGAANNLYYRLKIDKPTTAPIEDKLLPLTAEVTVSRGGSTLTTTTLTIANVSTAGSTTTTSSFEWDLASCLPSGGLLNGDEVNVVAKYRVNTKNLPTTSFVKAPGTAYTFYNKDALGNIIICNEFPLDLYLAQVNTGNTFENLENQLNGCSEVNLTRFISYVRLNGLWPYNNEIRPFSYYDYIKLTMPENVVFTRTSSTGSATPVPGTQNNTHTPTVVNNGNGTKTLTFNNDGSFVLNRGGAYNIIDVFGKASCSVPSGGTYKAEAQIRDVYYAESVPFGTPASTPSLSTIYASSTATKPYANQPGISLSNQTGSIQPSKATESFTVRMSSTGTATAPYTWLAVPTLAGVNVTQIVDVTANTPLTLIPYSGGVWAKLSTTGLASGTFKDYRIDFTYTTCSSTTLQAIAGWNCSGYPSDPIAYACTASKADLTFVPQPAAVQINTIAEPVSPINLCTVLNYEFQVNSAAAGNLINNKFNITLPAGLTITPGSLLVEYPAGAGNWQAVTTTTSGYTTTLDLTAHSNYPAQGIPGTLNDGGNINNRLIGIKFNATTDCSFTSGSYVIVSTDANKTCGQPATGSGSLLNTITLTVSGSDPGYVLSSTITNPTTPITDCVSPITMHVKRVVVLSTASGTPSTATLRVNYPQGYTITNTTPNCYATTTFCPTLLNTGTDSVSGLGYAVYSIPAGMQTTDFLEFDITFTPTGSLSNGNYSTTITTDDVINGLSCSSAPGGVCTSVRVRTSTATYNFTLQCYCYKPAVTSGIALDTNHGITALGRAGADNSNWPMVRKGAWTVLEAKTKGFVVNRLTDTQVSAIPSADLREGMMVYNITQDCLQINIDGTATGWRCFNTQTCPDL